MRTLSRRSSLLYRNQSLDLPSKSIDWPLYDGGFRHERVKGTANMRVTFFAFAKQEQRKTKNM